MVRPTELSRVASEVLKMSKHIDVLELHSLENICNPDFEKFV